MSKPNTIKCSLTDLMNALLKFEAPTPCYLFSRTVEPMNKFARNKKGEMGEKFPNPCLDDTKQDEKGKPLCKLVKFTKQLIRVNDNYETAVIRRQMTEAKMRGEDVKPEDLFVADKATWGAKVDKDVPSLFEWWVPEYTRDIQFYMAYRPVQCQEVWFEAVAPCTIDGLLYTPGSRIPDDVAKTLRAEYMKERDTEMEAMRQSVDRPVPWRKVRFDNILAMSIGGEQYEVADPTMPPVPEAQRTKLMQMVKDRDARKEQEERSKAEKKAGRAQVVEQPTVTKTKQPE